MGINPSTARPGALDPTLKSVERIARNSGFDSFIMFNVYAQRATSPDDMERTCNPELHRENMRAFAYILSRTPDPVVWAAWGTIIEKRDYLWPCLRDMIALGGRRCPVGHLRQALCGRTSPSPPCTSGQTPCRSLSTWRPTPLRGRPVPPLRPMAVAAGYEEGSAMTEKRAGLSAMTLKYIAMATMLVDHMGVRPVSVDPVAAVRGAHRLSHLRLSDR